MVVTMPHATNRILANNYPTILAFKPYNLVGLNHCVKQDSRYVSDLTIWVFDSYELPVHVSSGFVDTLKLRQPSTPKVCLRRLGCLLVVIVDKRPVAFRSHLAMRLAFRGFNILSVTGF